MKFLIFKLENPLSCSHHSMQIRAILAKNGVLGTTFDELEWVYPFRLELQKFSVAYFFSHFLRFHFIAMHHGIKITQIKKKLSFKLRMKINWKGHRLSSTNQALEKLNLRRKMSICVRVFFFCAWKYFCSNEIAHFPVPGQIVSKSNKSTDQQCSKSI